MVSERAHVLSIKSEGEVRMFRKFTDSIREFFNDVRGELKKVRRPIAMDQGLRFAVREGGKTVGSGVVTEILA